MKKHLITLFICAIFISPCFIFFSKNYKLLVEIILGTWASGYLFSLFSEAYFIKYDTDSYELKQEDEHGWLIQHVTECCLEIGITKPPKIRLDKNSGAMLIIGTKFSSTIVIAEEFVNEFHPDTVMAGITHELGHLYLDHTLIKTFLYMFIVIPRFLIHVLFNLMDLFSRAIGIIPVIGFIFNMVVLIYCVLAKALVVGFTSIVSAIEFLATRRFEYEADKFSYRLNGHEDLLIFFHFIEEFDKRSIFDFRINEHPKTSKRKARLLKYLSSVDEKYIDLDFGQFGECYTDVYPVETTGM